MAELTACYIDFQCPFSYRIWQWINAIGLRGEIEVRPFSLDAGDDSDPWERTTPSSAGLELLALGELAREHGVDAHRAFCDAAFAAVHDSDDDTTSLETWLALGAKVGLDLDVFTADSERWRAEVGLWHSEARDDYGVFGTPTLVFDDDAAMFVRLERTITDPQRGARLLDSLRDLASEPVTEVQRTR